MASPRGMTLVDILVGTGLFLIIFLALVAVLRISSLLGNITRAEAGADALLSSQMEYIRSLSYDAIGTTTGTPSGTLLASATSTTNGVIYTLQTNVAYSDDAHDGTGGSDTSGSTQDYKIVTLNAIFEAHGIHTATRSATFAPPHIENTTGGTVSIHVVDTGGLPVSGASVRVVHTTPSVDTTVFTNAKGIALFNNLAAGSGYQVSVTQSGYSSAQTYTRSTANENPTNGHLTVVANTTTANTFMIAPLGSLTIHTLAADLSPAPGISLSLQGARVAGVSSAGAPVFLNTANITTNGAGSATLSLPWDTYTIVPAGHAIASSSQELPYQLLPGASATIDLVTP